MLVTWLCKDFVAKNEDKEVERLEWLNNHALIKRIVTTFRW